MGRIGRGPRVLIFASAMHVWSDMFFALIVPLLPYIKEDMGLSFTQVGLLKSLYSGSSAVLQLPAGILAERVGEFWLLLAGNAWVAAGLMGMALLPGYGALLAVSFLGGLGGGTQHPLASSMVARAYESGGRSTAVGTVNFAGDIGKMLAPLVAGLLAARWGWRYALGAAGAAGLLFMLASTLARRAVEPGPSATGAPQEARAEGVGRTDRGGFVALSVVGFMDSATRGATLAFLPFVLESRGLGAAQVGVMLFLLFAGGALGKFVCGWLGDRFGSLPIVWATKGLTAALLVLSLSAPSWALGPLVLALGLGLNGTSSVLYAAVAELVPLKRRARLYGLYYTTNEGGTVLAPLFYGAVADLAGLSFSMALMGALTATLLPASLPLGRALREAASAARR